MADLNVECRHVFEDLLIRICNDETGRFLAIQPRNQSLNDAKLFLTTIDIVDDALTWKKEIASRPQQEFKEAVMEREGLVDFCDRLVKLQAFE